MHNLTLTQNHFDMPYAWRARGGMGLGGLGTVFCLEIVGAHVA